MVHNQFIIPGKIDMGKILSEWGYQPRYINDHVDKYNYIIHKTLEGRVFNAKIEADGYTPLSQTNLEEFLGKRYALSILKELRAKGIIQRDNYFIRGAKCYAYRVAPEHMSRAVLRDVWKSEVWTAKLKRQRDAYQEGKDSFTWQNLTKLAIRGKEATNYINKKIIDTVDFIDTYEHELTTINKDNFKSEREAFICLLVESKSIYNLYSLLTLQLLDKAFNKTGNEGLSLYQLLINAVTEQYNADLMAIKKFVDRDFFLEQPDPNNRVFTNLSNLRGDLRQFLYYLPSKTKKLVNLDIRNSQPYLFSLLLMQQYAGQVLPVDVKNYIDLTSGGKFYEYVMNLLDVPGSERDQFKKDFFAKIFYCTSYYSKRTEAGKIFNQEFPHVYAVINSYKSACYKDLSKRMQEAEAALIIGVIGGELVEQGVWYATIHDSVVVLEEHAEAVKALILKSFMAAVGVAPAINVEKDLKKAVK